MKNLLITILALFNFALVSATDYYVSSAGNDSNNGTSTSTAWKTIAKINSRTFSPGDRILFRRGDTWSTESLVIPSSGTSGNPVTFSNYGSGALPVFSYIGSYMIRATNRQYVVIDGIKIIDTKISATDHSGVSGIWYGIGFNNSSNCTVKNCDITLVGVAIEATNGSGYITISDNHIYNLRMVINNTSPDNDFGANPILLGGSNNTITRNTFEECWAPSYDYGYDGGAIEFFSKSGAAISNNKITHNTAINCNGFLEIGASAGGACANNLIAYNKIINCGIIGSYHTTDHYKMDIKNLQYYNNVVIETVSQYTKPGVLLYSPGASPQGALVVKNNIFWLANGTDLTWGGLNSGEMTHSNNIYRTASGSTLGITLASTEVQSTTAAIFTSTSGSPSTWNLQPISGSPAIKSGVSVGLTSDYAGNAVGNPPSIGLYESGGTAAATPPVYVSSLVSNTNPSLLEMTYDLSLANIVPAASSFTVLVNSVARTVNSVAISGTKVQLTLASPVVSGAVVTVAYTKPSTNPLQTTSAGQAASVTAQTVTNSVTGSQSAPAYVSSSVANATPTLLEIIYNQTLANIVPAASSFKVLVNTVATAVNSVAISGTKVQLTLASAIKVGDVITVSYTKPATNPLQTASGAAAATISAQTVTNNLIDPAKDAPVTLTMSISPRHVYRSLNVYMTYSSSLTSVLAPQVIRITSLYGSLVVDKPIVTGATSVKISLNLRSGVYYVKVLSKGLEMAKQKMYVY